MPDYMKKKITSRSTSRPQTSTKVTPIILITASYSEPGEPEKVVKYMWRSETSLTFQDCVQQLKQLVSSWPTTPSLNSVGSNEPVWISVESPSTARKLVSSFLQGTGSYLWDWMLVLKDEAYWAKQALWVRLSKMESALRRYLSRG